MKNETKDRRGAEGENRAEGIAAVNGITTSFRPD
jgi:hypothetical protein